ncbi:MAG: polyprenyl synthetase family protein [Anaerolineales bacterium]|uniref:Polyprenyl synthetase family protein n=1 Tax=Candidatus Desulfolinea nitratireducens TaxID=2841698 RepID=A0A8J6NL00_9CHLR|nr:polyprenyl synthetase family protein [Candidatus Desulfolinea nitratireducens]MBL6959912.1 polyprenyl synthetase family protein [Anaerolineales bacterium]
MNKIIFETSVQATIKKVEARMRAQANGSHPDLHSAVENLLDAGGKRIRPMLTVLTGNMLNADQDRLITLAAAIEMLHTATLVHDDLIDGSLMRRGNSTLNARWTPAATVLTGDFVFARAAKLAAETKSLLLMDIFAETLAIIVNGELTQMFESRGLANRKNYYERIYAKTGSLFELSTRGAAIISEVDAQTVENIQTFGREIGTAFQIMDDILDFTGEQSTIGKPVGSDLLQGLITLPALFYIETHPKDENVKVLLSGEFRNEESMTALVESIRNSDAIQLALDEAREYTSRALNALNGQPKGAERQALEDLANYVTSRDA